MKLKILASLLCLSFLNLYSVDTLNIFSANVTAKAFDRYTGTLYLGTAENDSQSLYKAERTATAFTEIHTDAAAIDHITLVNNGNQEASHLSYKQAGSNNLYIYNFSNTLVSYQEPGTHTNDIVDSNGTTAHGIDVIAGSPNYVFLRVYGNSGDNAQYSGILAYNVYGANTFTRVNDSVSNHAAKLDNQRGLVGDGSFLRNGSNTDEFTAPPSVTDMYWDNNLETLFIAGNLTVENPEVQGTYNYFCAISKIKINDDGKLVISDVIPVGINPSESQVEDNVAIFASTIPEDADYLNHPRIYKICTMKTSTGKYYLIVNGGIDIDEGHQSTNKVWALRYNPDATDDTVTGMIVPNDNSEASDHLLANNFVLHGASATLSLDGLNSNSLKIGGENAPWAAADGMTASDMEVIGDTVYVSFSGATRSATNDPGVWASQALFDDHGVIIGWTKWERVYPSVENNTHHEDQTKFFAVDAKNCKFWQVRFDTDGNPTTATRTACITGSTSANSLIYQIHDSLKYGCLCCLDLPAGTPGLGYSPTTLFNSLVLFGGLEKVAFAMTESGAARAVTTVFTPGAYFKSTDLPSGAGNVRCLGYSRVKLSGLGLITKGYFYAGTDTGLYTWADVDEKGFSTIATGGLTNLNSTPFTAGSWQHMASTVITGAVSAIESDGQYIYIVEQDISSIDAIVSKLWKITIGNTFDANDPVLIAKSGAGNIPANSIFTGFKIVNNNTGEEAHGIISTNSGIYRSSDALAVMEAEAGSAWTAIDETLAYCSLYAPKRVPTAIAAPDYDGVNHKVTGIVMSDNPADNLGYYQNSRIYQFNTNEAMNATTAVADAWYTWQDASHTATLDRTYYFWSDGGRRLINYFDITKTDTYGSTKSIPYYLHEWDMIEPYAMTTFNQSVPRCLWVETVSGLGYLMVGEETNDGRISVVSFQ